MPRRMSVAPVASHTRTPDGNRDHPRNTPSTRRNAAAPTSRPTRTVVPSASAISMTASATADGLRDGEGLAGRGASRGRLSGRTWTGRSRISPAMPVAAANLAPPIPQQPPADVVSTRYLRETRARLLHLGDDPQLLVHSASVDAVQRR